MSCLFVKPARSQMI